jgi:two-component system sensor histidine kinase UhpB
VPALSLRFRINLLISVVTLLFVAILLNVVIDDARRSIREEMEGANRVTLQLLSTVLRDAGARTDPSRASEALLGFLRELGRVRAHDIRLFDRDDREIYASPPSVYKAGRAAPRWFSALVHPQLPVVNMPVDGGHLVVTVDSSRSILDAWDELAELMTLAVAFAVAVNALVFFLVGRSVRPVDAVAEGLQRMERGEFHTRLPRFAVPEFEAIGGSFNRMADALEASLADNRRLALIAQQSGDAIFTLDLEGRVGYWNPAAERLLGYGAAEMAGRTAECIVPQDGRAQFAAHAELIRARGLVDHVETVRLARDGRRVEVAVSAAPLVDPVSDTVIGGIWSLRDVTEAKRAREAEAELAQNRHLTRLIQTRLEEERRLIARELHDELGQYVTAVKTLGAVIANQTRTSGGETHRGAVTIVEVAERIYDIVHDIVRQLRPSALDHLGLEDALAEAVGNWRRLQPGMAVELRMEGELDGLGEETNITIYRIVQECLTNVVKHAQASRVDILVRRPLGEPWLMLTVSDDGRGLTERNAVEAARFGLLGMRERTEALGGSFELDAVPGAGVTVRVRLPAPAAAGEAAA